MTMDPKSATETASDREFVLTRVFDAPRELVFEAWTDPRHLIQWWGPRGFTNTFHEISVRPGGVWRFIMHGPDGVDYPNRIDFHQVVEPELITYAHRDDVEDGGVHFHARIDFEAVGCQTRLTLRLIFDTVEARDRTVEDSGASEGGNQTLDRLGEELERMKAAR